MRKNYDLRFEMCSEGEYIGGALSCEASNLKMVFAIQPTLCFLNNRNRRWMRLMTVSGRTWSGRCFAWPRRDDWCC